MNFDPYKKALDDLDVVRVVGRVVKVVGLVIEAQIQGVLVGDLCMVEIVGGDMIRAEVVGLKKTKY